MGLLKEFRACIVDLLKNEKREHQTTSASTVFDAKRLEIFKLINYSTLQQA